MTVIRQSAPHRRRAPRSARGGRPAFTLIEMLVVVTIIAIIVALSGAAWWSSTQSAKVRATVALLQTIHDEIVLRMEKTMSDAAPAAIAPLDVLAESPPGTPDSTRAATIGKIERLRTLMPQEFSDFLQDSFSNTTNMPAARRQYMDEYNKKFIAAKHNPETQSAACLYLILACYSVDGSTFSFSNLPANSVKDTDGDGLLEIVDQWGKPVRFYRWPVDLVAYFIQVEDSPTWPATLLVSNMEMDGKLYGNPWFASASRTQFENADDLSPAINPPSPWNPAPAGPAGDFEPDGTPGLPPIVERFRYFRLHQAYINPVAAATGTDLGPDPASPQPYPVKPVIISAGPDGFFGIIGADDFDVPPGLDPPVAPIDQMAVRCARVRLDKLKEFNDNVISLRIIATGSR